MVFNFNQKMGRKAVAQGVWCYPFVYTGPVYCIPDSFLEKGRECMIPPKNIFRRYTNQIFCRK